MSYVEEIFELVGQASRCWAEEGGKGVFQTGQAIAIADRLCEIVREAEVRRMPDRPMRRRKQ